jgi:hypothetical protein
LEEWLSLPWKNHGGAVVLPQLRFRIVFPQNSGNSGLVHYVHRSLTSISDSCISFCSRGTSRSQWPRGLKHEPS